MRIIALLIMIKNSFYQNKNDNFMPQFIKLINLKRNTNG